MKDEEKVALARKGNEFFNNGNMTEAIKFFVKAGYRDGIMRVADYYYFDKKQPLIALKFYKMINRKDRVDEIFARMMFALNKMLRPVSNEETESESSKSTSNEEIEVKIHPKLKILAEEIIRDNKGEK
ncbi:MAG TPA: hypothetical protein PKG60_12410 [Spirochaetota bacterium]|nr:hypothetical protein [Spirochaetota bacterium]HPS86963.1 hypothetical protein [Spirochaetota bacterium]